jgi:hypothetical protein
MLLILENEATRRQVVALVGPALGALMAVNAPPLKELGLVDCNLGDAGMRPLLEALPHNTHLKDLLCTGSGMSAAFARDVLLPAVRATTRCDCLTRAMSTRRLSRRKRWSLLAPRRRQAWRAEQFWREHFSTL